MKTLMEKTAGLYELLQNKKLVLHAVDVPSGERRKKKKKSESKYSMTQGFSDQKAF